MWIFSSRHPIKNNLNNASYGTFNVTSITYTCALTSVGRTKVFQNVFWNFITHSVHSVMQCWKLCVIPAFRFCKHTRTQRSCTGWFRFCTSVYIYRGYHQANKKQLHCKSWFHREVCRQSAVQVLAWQLFVYCLFLFLRKSRNCSKTQ